MHKVFLLFIPIISIMVQRNPYSTKSNFWQKLYDLFCVTFEITSLGLYIIMVILFSRTRWDILILVFFVCFLTWVWVHKGHGYNGQNPIWIGDQIPFMSLCAFYFFLFLCELCLVLFLCKVFSLLGCFSLIWFGIIVGCT
jgi:hypothetical protein